MPAIAPPNTSDPLDRRFHAQPVACPVCGPQVWLEQGTGGVPVGQGRSRHLRQARQLLLEGKILAIKGLGGFHLACDATNPQAVEELRRRKLRVDKPFALMMADLETVEAHCLLSPAETALLESRQRPIVIVRRRSDSPIAPEVAPGQNTLGRHAALHPAALPALCRPGPAAGASSICRRW